LKEEIKQLFEAIGIPVLDYEDPTPYNFMVRQTAQQEQSGVLVVNKREVDAFDAQAGWASKRLAEGGTVYAYFFERFQNLHYPNIYEYIHAEIVSYQGLYFLIDSDAFTPDVNRKQRSFQETAMELDTAFRYIAEWLPKQREYVQEAIRRFQSEHSLVGLS
jgi:hypothetical protein